MRFTQLWVYCVNLLEEAISSAHRMTTMGGHVPDRVKTNREQRRFQFKLADVVKVYFCFIFFFFVDMRNLSLVVI